MDKQVNKKPRVRIAPSPTGNLHIGTARAALFNWIYAKSTGGTFVLRIEDTDLERSEKKFETDIFDGLQWLGLNWDEGPGVGGPSVNYRQSERLDIYEKYLSQLLNKGLAYYCRCTKEELEIEREKSSKLGLTPKYNGKCRAARHPDGEVIRIIIPEEKISFIDIIRGEISFDGGLIGDIAIAKNLKTPLYNFAVVIDDYEMQISHVIRGEDHIANTPKQIFIQIALGFPMPQYAHLPLILDQNRAKLSKRFSATAVIEYKNDGFLPEAIVNFLTLLGWHPDDDKEIMPIDEIINKFSLERIQKSGAVFDIEKLKWLNGNYIRALSEQDLIRKIYDFDNDSKKLLDKIEDGKKIKLIAFAKERMSTLKDFFAQNAFFGEIGEYTPNLLVWKKSTPVKALENLTKIEEIIKNLPENFSKNEAEQVIMPLAEKLGKGDILWPLRVALSGLEASPGPLEILEILGKKEAIKRIRYAQDQINSTLS